MNKLSKPYNELLHHTNTSLIVTAVSRAIKHCIWPDSHTPVLFTISITLQISHTWTAHTVKNSGNIRISPTHVVFKTAHLTQFFHIIWILFSQLTHFFSLSLCVAFEEHPQLSCWTNKYSLILQWEVSYGWIQVINAKCPM